MPHRPLEGVRVLDISRLYPGALATKRLADMGADVVKVEEPGRGDYIRTIPPLVDGRGVLHMLLDPGKRSVALDLKQPADLDTFLELAEVADVLVESARPGRYLEMGIDFQAMRARRPQLVVCSISGFGQTGPLAPLASHGMNMDALSGTLVLADWNGRRRFVSLGFSIGVELGALNAAFGIAAAIYGARANGQGGGSTRRAGTERSRHSACPSPPTSGPARPSSPKPPRSLYDVYETSDAAADAVLRDRAEVLAELL